MWYVGRGEGDVWYEGGLTVMSGIWEVVTVMCMWGGVRVMCGMREGEGDEWHMGRGR